MGDWKKPMNGLVKSVRDYLDAGYRELKAELVRSREENERREEARLAGMVCVNCAASIPEGEHFCKRCGACEAITRREFEAREEALRRVDAEQVARKREANRKARDSKMEEFQESRRGRAFERGKSEREATERELLERKFQDLRRTPICPACRTLYPGEAKPSGTEAVRRFCGKCGRPVQLVGELFSEEEMKSWSDFKPDDRTREP